MPEPVEIHRRGRPKASVKNEIERRAEKNQQAIIIEARKLAAMEIACEKLEEIYALLSGAGFKVPASKRMAAAIAAPQSAPAVVARPCKLCGREATIPDGTGSWLCPAHAAYEKGTTLVQNAVPNSETTSTTAPIVAKPVAQNPNKMIIQATEEESTGQQQPFDIMKGNGGVVRVLDD